MKIANPMKWGFDPTHVNFSEKYPYPAVLSCDRGRLIWGTIRSGHIVDQYFNDACLRFLMSVEKNLPINPKELRALAESCGLGAYGVKSMQRAGSSGVAWWADTTVPDMEFWGELFNALTGKLNVIMEFPEKHENKIQQS